MTSLLLQIIVLAFGLGEDKVHAGITDIITILHGHQTSAIFSLSTHRLVHCFLSVCLGYQSALIR